MGTIAGSAEHHHRTPLPGCMKHLTEMPGAVHKWGPGLLRAWWWPIGSKLVFGQMATPQPEFLVSSGIWFDWVFIENNYAGACLFGSRPDTDLPGSWRSVKLLYCCCSREYNTSYLYIYIYIYIYTYMYLHVHLWEQGAEENIWTKEGWSDGRMEKNA
jgi:hypothetical protein